MRWNLALVAVGSLMFLAALALLFWPAALGVAGLEVAVAGFIIDFDRVPADPTVVAQIVDETEPLPPV